jgi:outer membrane immunogenic protein
MRPLRHGDGAGGKQKGDRGPPGTIGEMNRTLGAALLRAALPAAALAAATLPARAADIQRSTAAAPAPWVSAHDWTGAYAGLNLGYVSSTVGALGRRPSGVSGGAQAGYNWQVGQVVFGGEADIQGTSAEDIFAPYKYSNPWFGTARGRLGYAFGNILAYATAGLTYGKGRLTIAGLSEGHTQLGWTAGGGVEIGFTPGWSARTEYLFIGLPDQTFVLSGIRSGTDAHLLRFGVNYRF